jgi:hypothetical protein
MDRIKCPFFLDPRRCTPLSGMHRFDRSRSNLNRIGAAWQLDAHRRSAHVAIDRYYVATMGNRHLAHESQTQPGPAIMTATGIVGPAESFEAVGRQFTGTPGPSLPATHQAIRADLADAAVGVGRKRVARLMTTRRLGRGVLPSAA